MAVESTCAPTISRSCLEEDLAPMSDRCNYQLCWSHGAMISLLQVPRGRLAAAARPWTPPPIHGRAAILVETRTRALSARLRRGLPPSSCGHGRRLDHDASWDAHEKLPPHHRPPIVAEAWDARRRRRNRMSRPRLRYRNANGRTGVARRNRISDNNVLLGHTMTGNAARSAPPRMRATVTFSLSVQR